MRAILDKFKKWKEKAQARTLEKDKVNMESAKKSLEMWKSAERLEQEKLKVAEIQAKAKDLAVKRNELKYGKALKSFKNMGSALMKASEEYDKNEKKDKWRRRKKRKKEKKDDNTHDGFLDLGLDFKF